MQMSELKYQLIKQKDGFTTKLTHYVCPTEPMASILILHGMAEHQKRYHSFAEYLVDEGFDVYIYNHRGHGSDRKISELGFFAPENGDLLVVEDAIAVCEFVEKNNRSKNFFLLGHSMGSLIARNVIQSYDKFTGVILSGTTHPPKLLSLSGVTLAGLVKRFKGPKHVSPFLSNLLFGSKKYTSLSTRTAFDWLTRSNPVVGAYIHDPYCGFTCTASFYQDLLRLARRAGSKKLIKLTKRELPIYIVSGDKDPVSGYGKEIHKYLNLLKRCGFHNISSKLYPECRHEILNELNNEEVYSDIKQWISKRL